MGPLAESNWVACAARESDYQLISVAAAVHDPASPGRR